jgi:hypothetical protein
MNSPLTGDWAKGFPAVYGRGLLPRVVDGLGTVCPPRSHRRR